MFNYQLSDLCVLDLGIIISNILWSRILLWTRRIIPW